MHDHCRMYAGLGKEMDLEESSERLMHQDGEGFWDEILAYLHLEQLLKSQFKAKKIKRRARRFFILNGVLWHKNGTKPPLLVIVTICNTYRSLPDLFPTTPDQMRRSRKHSEGSKQRPNKATRVGT